MIIKKIGELILEEASVRMPVSKDYWIKRGKKGKDVALYTHDDMDGIFTAIEMKKWLLNKGFNIVKYGVLNYSEGWKYTTLDPKLINVVLDFANMPGDERDELVDYYLDHHGGFTEEEKEKYKNMPVQKVHTSSAYEAVCLALGVPMDELTLSVIDMIDSAKYDEYEISWQRLLDFNLSEIKKSKKARLEFGAAFNQFLKRSDTKTLVSVIHNCKDASIFGIYHAMKKVYPEHNIKMGKKKDFIKDAEWRLGTMKQRTIGVNKMKKAYKDQEEFLKDFKRGDKIKLDGYQLIGDLIFVPTGTWANALRARSIVEKSFMDGLIPYEPKFILLQYGGTLQVCSYKKIDEMENPPILKNGESVTNLGKYMTGLLENFEKYLGYKTVMKGEDTTVSGGHGGIGSISNIFGKCKKEPYVNHKFVEMFKNKIINDLSGVKFSVGINWSPIKDGSSSYKPKDPEMDFRVIDTGDVTKLTGTGELDF